MADKIVGGRVRVVVMRPEVIEFEYSGTLKLLSSVATHYAKTTYPDIIKSAHDCGPVNNEYAVKVMEVSVDDKIEENPLEDMVAPGIA